MDEVVEVSKAAAERGKMALAKVAHFVPRTKRYDEMVAWYRAVLEAGVMAATRALQAAAPASRGPNFQTDPLPVTDLSRPAMTRVILILAAAILCAAPTAMAEELNDHRLPHHLDSWIALATIGVAVVVSVMLNGAGVRARVAGTVFAALACFGCVIWFFLALDTGVLENPRPPTFPTDGIKPALLWSFTALAFAGGIFLCWAAVRQRDRADTLALTMRNDVKNYGRVSRYLHWITAILFVSLVPMGIFTSMIPEHLEWRPGYYVVHKTIGFVVLILVAVRVIWHFVSRRPSLDRSLRPWERVLAKIVHYGLYFLMLALPISGFVMSTYGGKLSHFFVWDLPLFWERDTEAMRPFGLLHKLLLPGLFLLIFAAHVAGALKHHFIDKHRDHVHRIVS